MFYRIIVWKNLNADNYYYKKIKGFYNEYYIGFKNVYNHEVIMIIDLLDFYEEGRTSFKKRFIDKIISCLSKIR